MKTLSVQFPVISYGVFGEAVRLWELGPRGSWSDRQPAKQVEMRVSVLFSS